MELHHCRPQTFAQIAHDILETSPEQRHGISNQLEDKMGDESGDKLGWKTSQEAETASQTKDKTREPDTASHCQTGRHDKHKTGSRTQHPKLKNKPAAGRQVGDKTPDTDKPNKLEDWETKQKRRRTQHPSQGGHTTGSIEKRKSKTVWGKNCRYQCLNWKEKMKKTVVVAVHVKPLVQKMLQNKVFSTRSLKKQCK